MLSIRSPSRRGTARSPLQPSMVGFRRIRCIGAGESHELERFFVTMSEVSGLRGILPRRAAVAECYPCRPGRTVRPNVDRVEMTSPVDILLVDDEVRNLVALEAILADPAYRLHRAEGADEALRVLLKHDVAAMVLDIKMPGLSGLELARMIKDRGKFCEMPIVFLSAYMVEDQHVIEGYGAGGVDYMTKLVNPDILRHKVAVFADLFRKTRELAELNETLEARVRERTAKLERSEALLRAANAQKDEFLAILAHELRNPLAPLRTGLNVLLREQASTPRVARTLVAMNRQLDHVVHLVEDLLDVARISRGSLELRKKVVNLETIVEGAIESTTPFFETKDQKLALEVEEGLTADVDPIRITQILSNLLHNAGKFTPTGGSIRLELGREGRTAVVRVIDTGVGIPTEQIERVFEMFARTSSAGESNEGGLGIGLALARRLTEMHGGTLRAFSEGVGRGTTLVLSLPLADESVKTAALREDSTPTSGVVPRLNVLIIEDNEDVANTLLDWLESSGHRVSLARTGSAGVELAVETHPNVVLCDLGLPGMDGFEVCRSIRAIPVESPPMMVALSGHGKKGDVSRTREAGFDHHLIKPVATELLDSLFRTVAH